MSELNFGSRALLAIQIYLKYTLIKCKNGLRFYAFLAIYFRLEICVPLKIPRNLSGGVSQVCNCTGIQTSS